MASSSDVESCKGTVVIVVDCTREDRKGSLDGFVRGRVDLGQSTIKASVKTGAIRRTVQIRNEIRILDRD